MSVRTAVVGIGQAAAGDDGVGLVVVDELERRAVPPGTRLVRLAHPLDLVPLLAEEERVLLVDAVLATPPGQVVELSPGELSAKASQPASSHGLGAAQAIELARALSANLPIGIIAVTIARPERYGLGLSPAVAQAVPKAAERILELLAQSASTLARAHGD